MSNPKYSLIAIDAIVFMWSGNNNQIEIGSKNHLLSKLACFLLLIQVLLLDLYRRLLLHHIIIISLLLGVLHYLCFFSLVPIGSLPLQPAPRNGR